MNLHDYANAVTSELNQALNQIDPKSVDMMIEALEGADEIFVSGAGRSGFMARAFTMRLMHMGRKVYLVGETVTPNLRQSDVLVVCSGSGETKSLVSMAQKAKSLDAKVVLVTINPESTIGKLADVCVRINAPSPKAAKEGDLKSIQPMGNLFEQSLLLYLDICVMLMMDKMNLTGSEMFTRHANLE